MDRYAQRHITWCHNRRWGSHWGRIDCDQECTPICGSCRKPCEDHKTKKMNFLRKHAFVIFIGFVIAFLYHNWFSKGLLTAPDFSYISPLQLHDLKDLPFAWSSMFGSGLGGSTFNILNLETYLHLGVQLVVFLMHIPWNAAYRILFFWPFLLIGSVSSFYFCHEILKHKAISRIGNAYLHDEHLRTDAGGWWAGRANDGLCVRSISTSSFIKRNTVLFIFRLQCFCCLICDSASYRRSDNVIFVIYYSEEDGPLSCCGV